MADEDFIRDWHRRLCAEMRRFDRNAEATLCQHCKRPRKDHVDGERRCSICACTTHYLAVNADEFARTQKTLILVEEIAAANEWAL